MRRRIPWMVAVLAISCGDGGTNQSGQDLPSGDPGGRDLAGQDQGPGEDPGRDPGLPDPGRDTLVPDAPPADGGADVGGRDDGPGCPGNFGCPCTGNNECISGFCIESIGGRQCTRICVTEESCPAGWSCSQNTLGGETIYLCVDPFSTLCRPCRTDRDCVPTVGTGSGRYACLPFGPEGSFCGTGCTGTSGCPDGYQCLEVSGVAGGRWCVPEDSGSCACTDYMRQEGFLTDCRIENEFGSCPGTRTCAQACQGRTPAAETCNAIDDNCNGATDEGTAGRPCDLVNEHGTCQGTTACKNGEIFCEGTAPKAEVCNGIDDDCNGTTDPEGAGNCISYYRDSDGDGSGLTDDSRCLCAPQSPYTATTAGDCNDQNGQVKPGALEICNGIDDNCDGRTDEEGASNCLRFYRDSDGDGVGAPGTDRCLCAAQSPWTASRGDDCNDEDVAVSPLRTEGCNGIDDNCDGQTDEGTTGTPCAVTNEYGSCPGTSTCNSGIPGCTGRNPAPESCNGVDDDCNGQTDEAGAAGCTDWYMDHDGDGWGVAGDSRCLCQAEGSYRVRGDRLGDCNDRDGGIHPGAPEACNGKDDDCDGSTDEEGATGCSTLYLDLDGDSWGAVGSNKCLCPLGGLPGYTAARGQDCDDQDASVNPGAAERCTAAGFPRKDEDCDGSTDEENATGCTNHFRDQDGDTWGSQSEVKCLCQAQGEYTATRSGDCCDLDPRALPGQTGWFTQVNACGSFDYDCSNTAERQYGSANGRCTDWAIGTGCVLEPGWQGSTVPNCGETRNYVSGGCGYCCIAWVCCCDPEYSSRTQGCH